MKKEDIQDKCEICALVTLFIISILAVSPDVYAGTSHDNHVHIEQVNSGDGVDININQIGYDNYINFSFDHANNVFNLNQYGNGNYAS